MRKIKKSNVVRLRFLGDLKTVKQIEIYGRNQGYGNDFDSIFYKELEKQLINAFGKWGYNLNIPVEKVNNMKILKFGATKHDFWGAYDPEDDTWAFQATMVYLPKHLIEYLVLHELCHYFIFNHGKDFDNMMRMHMPDFLDKLNELEEIELKANTKNWLRE